jgi:hypothetical protein
MTVVLWQASEAVLLMPVLFAGSEQAYSDERVVFHAAQREETITEATKLLHMVDDGLPPRIEVRVGRQKGAVTVKNQRVRLSRQERPLRMLLPVDSGGDVEQECGRRARAPPHL